MRRSLILAAALSFALTAGAMAQTPSQDDLQKDFDAFWQEEEYHDDLLDGTGTGGGPSMQWFKRDLDEVNAALEAAGLLALPEKSLYWGGQGWYSVHSGDRLFVALGGGGYGGGGESERGDDLSRFTRGAGWFGVKGILPLHRRVFVEGGLSLGAGSSSVLVERTDAGTGIINVHLRGDRVFLLARPHAGIDLRLARWVGILVEGGYELTSGDWTLKGERDLIDGLDFGDGNGPFAAVTLRFGI